MAETAVRVRDARTPDADVAADPVCAFYTAHPYPPPVENLDRARDEWRDVNRDRGEYHLVWPDRPYRADLDILVAGCGAWQAAKYAVCRPAARVVGIDVSTTSLDRTEQLRRRYRLGNLETRLMPLERVDALERRFDLIVCTGVLHHLADPDTGLRALRSVLKPDGAVHLMVYARHGRAGVSMLQEYCRRLGIGPSRDEIEQLAAALQKLSPNHPAAALLRHARDVSDVDALADALLNPRERAYSVPELLDLLERNGFVLGRWQRQAPYLPQCGAISTTPHGPRLSALPEREQYAAMELWRGTMAHHSAVIHPTDSSRGRGLSGSWLRYVPIRLAGTVCVQEQLPAGAAAVLLNRGHVDRDLILAINSEEKRMFDAIDGRRTTAEIVELSGGGPGACARALTFFEDLWWYDQVVFDASRSTA